MKCITCLPPTVSSIVRYNQSNQHFNSVKPLSPSYTSKASWFLQWRNGVGGSFTTGAAPATLFLAATSPPNSGDLSVLFQTSAVMLFMYWIANFVVPELVMKDLQRDEANSDAKNDQNPSDNGEGSKPRRTAVSGTKKRGFGSTRP